MKFFKTSGKSQGESLITEDLKKDVEIRFADAAVDAAQAALAYHA